MEFSKFFIHKHNAIIDALCQLNELHSVSMTLFVIDEEGRMIGSLTDGDIRRGLIHGANLNTSVENIMFKDFCYLNNDIEINQLKELRDRHITLVPILDINHKILDVIDLTQYRSALNIDAVLMAGGKGERLRPLTLETPKPLLKIGPKTIIDRNIDRLIEFGIKNISVTVNYLKEQLLSHYAEPKDNGIKINCVVEQQFFGTIGALKLIRGFKSDTILVMNSDLLTDIDFEDFYLHFKEHNAMMSAAAIPYNISVPYGIFNLVGRDIKGVSEKPIYNHYANAGIYLIRKEALRYIPDEKVFNATDLIETLALDGQKVIRYPLTGLWIDIGTPAEYRKAQEIIKHIDTR